MDTHKCNLSDPKRLYTILMIMFLFYSQILLEGFYLLRNSISELRCAIEIEKLEMAPPISLSG